MSASPYRIALVAAVVFALSPSSSEAQRPPGASGELFTDNYDFQLFEPFDLDLDNQPVRGRRGYFLSVEKLYWAVTGERFTIGAPGVTQTAENIFPTIDQPADPDPTNPLNDLAADLFAQTDQGLAPPPFEIPNGIQNASPSAEFGYGDRYEFGYTDGQNGVLIGILDGPTVVSDQTFGFGEGFPFGGLDPNAPAGSFPFGTGGTFTDTPGIDPFFTGVPIDANANGVGDGSGTTADFRAFGFGSVPVSFNAPEGFFLGFRDFVINLVGATNGTNTGIINAPLNVGSFTEDFDPDDDADLDVGFIVDDIDGDGNPGAVFIIDPVSGLPVLATDFGDLFEFNVFFDLVNTRNVTETQGIELMRTINLDNRNWFSRDQNKSLSVAYGVRFLRVRDTFGFLGLGSVLGQTSSVTQTDNQLIGPQVALRYANQRGKWRFEAQGRAFAAYNLADISQTNLFGGELVPGGANRLLFGRPTATAFGQQQEEISPLVELRLNSRYNLTNALSLNLGYTLTFIDNLHRSSLATEFTAPTFGIGDGRSNLFVNGLSFGLEGRY